MPLDLQHLVETTGVAIGRSVAGSQKRLDDLEGQLRADDSATDAQDVHVVVLDTLVRGVGVVTDGRSDTGNLVGRDADAHATAADQDSSIGLAPHELARDGDCEIWVITAVFRVGSAIDQLGDKGPKPLGNRRFQGETGVVAAEGESHLDSFRHQLISGVESFAWEAVVVGAVWSIDTASGQLWPRGHSSEPVITCDARGYLSGPEGHVPKGPNSA